MSDKKDDGELTIAAISGSLRRRSYNTASLMALRELAPSGVVLDVLTLHDIELFDADVEAQGWPEHVKALRERVSRADGVVIATPEYNYGITGVLKNALDWLSRPTGEGPIVGLPATIIGASTSTVGTARAQSQLRDVFFYNSMPLLSTAEVLISRAADKFDDDGRLTHEPTRRFLEKMLDQFLPWVRQHASTAAR